MKRISVALAAAALSFGAFAQQRNFDAVQIKATEVAPGIYMLEGEGGNIGVSAGEDGVFLIDDQFAPLTPKIVAAVNLRSGSMWSDSRTSISWRVCCVGCHTVRSSTRWSGCLPK